ncbi:lipopolysaccharide biosynthesis protein [Clostridium minihomine]|uniref:lipopolysaccharide biosynthesis protein n=1 Tax=Clostridium minihomine TaxID=2045012 RepID=UPI000C75C1D0|nr:oligosaccharide flippase family protein [Clostridium minihomine]
MSFFTSKLNSLKKNRFLKNVAVLTGGTAVAQVLLPFAFMPILSRMYGPELQGIYGTYVVITNITQQIACFRYDYAIVVADSDEEAGGAFVLSAELAVLFSIFIGLVMWPFIPQLGALFNMPSGAENTLWMVPLTTLICGLTTALNYFNVRHEQYKVISAANIIRVSVMIATQLILGYLGASYWGMIIGQFLSYFFGNFRMVMTLKGRIHRSMFRSPFLKKVARKNAVYPKYMLPSAMANSLSLSMIGLFIPIQYGQVMSGYYSKINTLLGLPSMAVSSAVSQVFLRGAAADKHNGEKLNKTFATVTKWLTILSILPFGFLLLWGDPIIPWFLGPEWAPIPEYLKYLVPLFMVRFIVTPLTNSAIALGRQKATMVWQFFLLATVSVPSLLTFVIPMTFPQYLLAASLPMACAYLIFYRFCRNIVRNAK